MRTPSRPIRLALHLALAAPIATPPGAQPPARAATPHSLSDALRRADSAAFGSRVAEAQRRTLDAQALAPLRGILPTLRVEAALVRTTDPVAVFGTTMRQRNLAAADFNPATLNRPGVAANVAGGVVADIPLLNADAWAGRTAARTAARAARDAGDWARLAIRADVVRAWFGVLLADERAATLAAGLAAARAHVAQAATLQRNGVVTSSDAMLAGVRAADVEAQLLEATAAARTARQSLGVLLGASDGELVTPAGALPDPPTLRAAAAGDSLLAAAPRRDESAAHLAAEAAGEDGRRARAENLPRLNSFARYDWNDRATPFAGEPSWTVGVVASWTIVSGGSTLSATRAAAGREAAARAAADGVTARARLERDDAERALRVALERLSLAERSAVQGADAHRIVERRYEGGLAAVTELLDAQATQTATALGVAKARFDVVAALAARRLALGLDPGSLAALDDTTATPNRPTKEHD
ncbi:MAG: TolC family protein [Gemmatimonadetes bacterium]|nr:TolC family protein [Gemmatimonadota bacterium]